MVNRHIKLVVLISSSTTFILGILVGTPIEHAVSKYLEKKSISYEGIHSFYESIEDAQKYIEIEGLTPFEVSLDDPLIDTYHILKIKLNNEGSIINNSLKFNIAIGNQFAKIIDIKHRVITPENKNLLITDTIPSLSWSMDALIKEMPHLALSWQPPQQRIGGSKITDIAGYNIYGSATIDLGYGQINEKLIKESSWRIGDDQYPFFKVQVVDLHGLKSKLSSAIPFPEAFAFSPFFDDVAIIEPSIKSDLRAHCNDCKIYESLSQAIEKEGAQSTFLINKKKSDTLSLDNLVDKIYYKNNVLYADNILNMKGEADILMPTGLDEDSEIIFYILYKIWPKAEHDVNFSITGHSDIQLVKENDISTHVVSNDARSNTNTQKKYKTILTPPVVSSYISNNKIYLLWDHPKDISYQGVRIFRSIKSEKNNKNLGNEVYDGSGEIEKLICRQEISKESQNILGG